ncbi:MAG: aldehyde dehydrogenase [Candidatus Thioglobus sp.]|jgi:acyl-CoA reductase-like NAD-dependent aldehyde dehydrogenase|nr:aldehyde dehydrogenase [Candidatus Pseudothioglobus aerophilus]MBT4244353.1 aldehyde dehydrogenase [Gammaproteobacteria bacterium]MDB4025931.1 aldehyde dehydrogenase [Candidatus Thioglobus sp.]MBT4975070.1 aldehyde dehydrogenase [Gammaproteobacteria bacterium]MBT5408198.1 aldehyde dehydrogenase [Gammaproteobacteria bacterium]|tara:strand:- start:1289 stop:2758 length:1470 start_codon:yes stop_codon:yes gene_type:complete
MEHFKHYINGKFSSGSERFETLNPANGMPWATFPSATEDESNFAIESAHKALYDGAWSSLTPTQRGKLIHRLGDLISEHASELGDLETRDSGKLAVETRAQSSYVSDYYYYYAGLADKIQGEVLPIDKPDMRVFTTREPIGVVVAIVPWNAQLFLSATKIAPALAAGNTLVVKASEQAPAALFKFAELVEKSGFPPGVINIITGFAEPCGRVLTTHPKVARIAFTGGTEVARHIVRNSAENFAHVSLELGGKSPMLIFEDCNIDGAVNGIIAGNFGASGQSCVAGSRVFIQRSIHSKIVDKIKERAKNIIVGDPLDSDTQVGPLATKHQVERALSVVKQSIKQGASLIFGGNKPSHKKEGWYFEPTLLDCPNQEFDCVKTELFAPVISVIAFDTEEEAIRMANDSAYGLGAGVFTENLARAHRVSEKIQSGIVWINTYRAISPIAPFGGVKQSGGSREAGIDAIHEYTRTKTTWINTSSEPMSNPFIMR